jgi:hypothetical protein
MKKTKDEVRNAMRGRFKGTMKTINATMGSRPGPSREITAALATFL